MHNPLAKPPRVSALVVFTLLGGCFGFYAQDALEKRHREWREAEFERYLKKREAKKAK